MYLVVFWNSSDCKLEGLFPKANIERTVKIISQSSKHSNVNYFKWFSNSSLSELFIVVSTVINFTQSCNLVGSSTLKWFCHPLLHSLQVRQIDLEENWGCYPARLVHLKFGHIKLLCGKCLPNLVLKTKNSSVCLGIPFLLLSLLPTRKFCSLSSSTGPVLKHLFFPYPQWLQRTAYFLVKFVHLTYYTLYFPQTKQPQQQIFFANFISVRSVNFLHFLHKLWLNDASYERNDYSSWDLVCSRKKLLLTSPCCCSPFWKLAI